MQQGGYSACSGFENCGKATLLAAACHSSRERASQRLVAEEERAAGRDGEVDAAVLCAQGSGGVHGIRRRCKAGVAQRGSRGGW